MYDKTTRRLTLKGRRWIYGIALAVMPILTAVGIVTEELAVLWVTLIGAILVPGLAISDQNKMEQATEDSYFHGVDEGWQAANDDNRRGIELATERDIPRGKRGLYE